ncbi:MAG: hypothetical protein RL095_1585 [Verrucomicrobiota bacterium]|jgi:hypothetical protein
MILASFSISFPELLGSHILLLLCILLFWSLSEKKLRQAPPLFQPLVILPLAFLPLFLVLVALINPVSLMLLVDLFLSFYRKFLPTRILVPCLLAFFFFSGLILFGYYALYRNQARASCFLTFGLIGVAPMIFALSSLPAILLQGLLAWLVLQQCLRHGNSDDFPIRLLRSCSRCLLGALILSWILYTWDTFQGLASMTGNGKEILLILSFSNLFLSIGLQLLVFVLLQLHGLRQENPVSSLAMGDVHEN